jgi:hypothetical protein
MKKLLLLLSMLSFSALANTNCESDTYTKTWHDYDSSWNNSCVYFIKAAMKEKGCSGDTVRRINSFNVTQMNNAGSLMCVFNGEGGVYQVMASQMAEPHVAVLLFSRWD